MILTRICSLPGPHLHHFSLRGLIVAGLLGFWAMNIWAQPVVTIGRNFMASTLKVDSSAVPPDSNGAAGTVHFVEFINGRFSVFNKTDGIKVKTMTDISFWTQAGITIPSGWDVTDPRIIYDSASQRWFASQVDFDPSGVINTNRFLLAVSTTAYPTGAWQAVTIPTDPGGNNFADYPTLGLDAQGVYLGGDMFDANANPVGPSLVSIPKAGLLANPPVISGLTRFGTMNYNVRGDILQPVTCFDGSGQGNVLSVASIGLDLNGNFVTTNKLVLFQVHNPGGPGVATLTASSFLSVPAYTVPLDPTQPDGSVNLDDGDARMSAKVYEVGGVLYAVHNTQYTNPAVPPSTQSTNLAALQWYRIDGTTHAVLESGTIVDPVMDLFYPSIAANSSGTVVIACNGSSSANFIGGFALVGTTVNGVTTFAAPLLLKEGVASYQNTDSTGTSRWGDYSALCVDPVDSARFWTIQEFPSSRTAWSTQVTELITSSAIPVPNLSIAESGNNVVLSWTGTSFTLETTPILTTPNWTAVTQNFSTNNGVVTATLPADGGQGFFRLKGP